MSNTFGTFFRLTAYGESHGLAIGGVVDGCPAGIVVDCDFVARELARRHVGQDSTQRREADQVEFLSGIFDGRTLGTPIAFAIRNGDVRSEDYAELASLCRPGHADYTYEARYGCRDPRGGGRASGRETAARVVGGALAKMVLRNQGITVTGLVAELGEAPDSDSYGGIVECRIEGLRAGVGNPVFGKLNARLAAAMMSIPSATGFEVGEGFAAARMTGSEFRDNWDLRSGGLPLQTQTNHCGGIQGGISNGMPVVLRVAFHAPTTVPQPTVCANRQGRPVTVNPHGRHDRCHVPRTVVVVESMAAMTVADLLLS